MANPLVGEGLFWKKKEYLSFVLSILVFLIHISSVAQYANSGSAVGIFNEKAAYFFKESITRFAVPMFFMLSGVSFFKGYDNTKYKKKMASRVFTLILPYLVWNTLSMLFEIVCSYSFLSKYFIARKPFESSVMNILGGVFFYKCNGAFWFMFDLIVFSLAAPLVYTLIRNKYVGISAILVISGLSLFGIELPASVFYTPNSIVFYLVGALIGLHFFDFAAKRSDKKTQVGSVVFLAAYILCKNVFSARLYDNPLLEIVIFTSCCFALWNAADLFIHKIKPRPLYARSFAVYAMHVNLAAIISKAIYLVAPKKEWFAIPNLLLTLVCTLVAINVACIVLEKYFPRIYGFLMGRRTKRS